MTTITEIARAAADAAEAKTAAEQAAQAVLEKAQKTQAEAQELESAAANGMRAATGQFSNTLSATMRALTDEVRVARKAAEDAVRSGSGDVLALWLEYRRTRARNRGQWAPLMRNFIAVTGRNAPTGEWGPDAYNLGSPGSAEGFEKFVTLAMHRAEQDIEAEADRDSHQQLAEARQQR